MRIPNVTKEDQDALRTALQPFIRDMRESPDRDIEQLHCGVFPDANGTPHHLLLLMRFVPGPRVPDDAP